MKNFNFFPILAVLIAATLGFFTKVQAQCPNNVSASTSTNVTLTYSTPFTGSINQLTITTAKGTITFSGGKIISSTTTTVNVDLSDPTTGVTTTTSSDVTSFISAGDGIVANQDCYTGTALPVTLVSFNLTKVGNDIVFQWKTATEENTEYFQIQIIGKDGAINVGEQIKANGNSTNMLSYKYILKNGKPGSYKLKITDCDGTAKYSNIKSIFFNDNTIKVFPNPTTDVVNIEGKFTQITITDVNGKVVTQSNNQGKIDISTLPKGIYFIKISDESRILKIEKLAIK